MRYGKAERLLHLAFEMQAARGGLTLDDIERRLGVKRRTAQRLRDAVMRVFPLADEAPSDERRKRWRLPAGAVDRLVGFGADELADLEVAIRLLKREGMAAQAASLERLAAKIKATMRPDAARRVEPDLEALIEAEGLAMRPGPRPRADARVLAPLRQAIKACRAVSILHRSRGAGRFAWRRVAPYGFLYGHRHYLVARPLTQGAPEFRLFGLPNIRAARIEAEGFARDPAFSLEAYARRSFGVFQEAPADVAWRFSPRAAADARDFVFHPEQRLEERPDGSLIVRFRAGGLLEMCWHLYAWGEDVEVLEPRALAEMCRGFRRRWPALP